MFTLQLLFQAFTIVLCNADLIFVESEREAKRTRLEGCTCAHTQTHIHAHTHTHIYIYIYIYIYVTVCMWNIYKLIYYVIAHLRLNLKPMPKCEYSSSKQHSRMSAPREYIRYLKPCEYSKVA